MISMWFQTFSLIKNQIVCDDTGDRMSHVISVTILVISALLVSSKQLVGDPISCWVPAHFTGNWEKYTENYCWIKNTYKLALDEHIPQAHEERDDLVYYQWVPLILLVQALFFYLPRLAWGALQRRSGLDMGNLIEMAINLKNSQKCDDHQGLTAGFVSQFHRVVEHRKKGVHRATISLKSIVTRNVCKCVGRGPGNYLVVAYFVVKLLYLTNILMQFFLLNLILGFGFSSFGIEVMKTLSTGKDWTNSVDTPFPRVTMCDIKVRRLGNIHRYSMQCVLPINLFNERLYLFLWFWLILVGVVTVAELLVWLKRLVLSNSGRRDYIYKHLSLAAAAWPQDGEVRDKLDQSDHFTDHYLRADGVFILRLIARNTNTVTVTVLTRKLFRHFLKWRASNKQPSTVNTSPPAHSSTVLPTTDKEKESLA